MLLTDVSAPSWSPDGTTIVFSAIGSDGHLDLWTVLASGDAPPRHLTTTLVDETEPSWGPQGRVAYAADTGAALASWLTTPLGDPPSASIQTIRTDGSDPVQITHGHQIGSAPSWSPDGQRILFTCVARGMPARCSIRTDFTGFEVIGFPTPPAELPSSPQGWESVRDVSLSPDGSTYAFVATGDGGERGIYVVDASGGAPRLLVASSD